MLHEWIYGWVDERMDEWKKDYDVDLKTEMDDVGHFGDDAESLVNISKITLSYHAT